MPSVREIVRRWPAALLAICGGTIAVGIVLSISLVLLDKQGPWKWYLVIFLFCLPPSGWVLVCTVFDIGLSLTRHELAITGIASVIATWLSALFALLASARYLDTGATFIVNLALEIAIVIAIPFAWRCVTQWYKQQFWEKKVQNVSQQAGIPLGKDTELEYAAKTQPFRNLS